MKKKSALEIAAMKFAKAWAAWHNTPDLMPSFDVVDGAAEILDALGVDLVQADNFKYVVRKKKGVI